MTDKTLTLFLIALFALVIPLSFGLALWIVARVRRKADRPLAQDAAGLVSVPVRQLSRAFRFFGSSQNSMNPRLEIVDDGLRFRVIRTDQWRFADIVAVGASRTLFGMQIAIRHRTEGKLYVDLADRERARDLLRRLPADLPYDKRVARLRDGDG